MSRVYSSVIPVRWHKFAKSVVGRQNESNCNLCHPRNENVMQTTAHNEFSFVPRHGRTRSSIDNSLVQWMGNLVVYDETVESFFSVHSSTNQIADCDAVWEGTW